MVRIGIDLGGTKIEGIVLSATGEALARRRIPTPRDYEATLDAITGLSHDLAHEAGATGPVGLGIPGAIVPGTGLVKNANSTWLIGRPLGRDLEARLARPVRLMNDANCFALSEAVDGAGAGARVVFGVILGTGVGGGIVIDGACHVGANLVAGEWGHNALPWMTPEEFPGDACYCGRRGCLETFLSGPALERDYARHAGAKRSGREIAHAAAGGDAAAAAALARHHDRLARGLASVINVLDPDVIVLGGGVSNIEGLPRAVSDALPRYVFSSTLMTRVVRHVHGDASGVRGAAWLWPAS